eukprot:52426-Prymnesium_polylepis.1
MPAWEAVAVRWLARTRKGLASGVRSDVSSCVMADGSCHGERSRMFDTPALFMHTERQPPNK